MKLLYLILFIFIVNCSGNKVSNYHGSKILEDKFNKIEINQTNKNYLFKLIGNPSKTIDFDKNKLYYFERLKTNQSLWKLGKQKIIKNNILIVEIDNSGILRSKKLLNLNDMNDLKYFKKTTKKEFEQDNIIYGVFSSLREKINAPAKKLKK